MLRDPKWDQGLKKIKSIDVMRMCIFFIFAYIFMTQVEIAVQDLKVFLLELWNIIVPLLTLLYKHSIILRQIYLYEPYIIV